MSRTSSKMRKANQENRRLRRLAEVLRHDISKMNHDYAALVLDKHGLQRTVRENASCIGALQEKIKQLEKRVLFDESVRSIVVRVEENCQRYHERYVCEVGFDPRAISLGLRRDVDRACRSMKVEAERVAQFVSDQCYRHILKTMTELNSKRY